MNNDSKGFFLLHEGRRLGTEEGAPMKQATRQSSQYTKQESFHFFFHQQMETTSSQNKSNSLGQIWLILSHQKDK